MGGDREVRMETVQTGGMRQEMETARQWQEMVTAGGQEMAQMGDARAGGSQLAGLSEVSQ